MKSYNNLWEDFVSFKNLFNAYKRARKSTPNKKPVLMFGTSLEQELFLLQEELVSGKYVFSGYRNFTIYDPKERIISAPHFRDVVVQHALINIIEPLFDKSFIDTSFACRKGKGTLKGHKTIKKIIQSKHPPKYYLKQDVKKYFPSVDKAILRKIISKKITDKKLLSVLDQIIESYSSFLEHPQKGIPIGNLTSQLFANIYLNELDQYAKHTLKIKHYFRYVDDILIFSNSKKELGSLRRKIKLFLNKNLFLSIPKNKTFSNLISTGVDFLGYKVYLSSIRLRKSNIKRFLKRATFKTQQLTNKKISCQSYNSSFFSFLGYAKHAKSWYLLKCLKPIKNWLCLILEKNSFSLFQTKLWAKLLKEPKTYEKSPSFLLNKKINHSPALYLLY